jgi:hypothetical protein
MVVEAPKSNPRVSIISNWGDMRADTGRGVIRPSQTSILPQTFYLKRKRSWFNLFSGFTSLRGVTYVTSPGFLLELFGEEHGFEHVDILVGHSLADTYKDQLKGEIGQIQLLYERIESGSLRVRSSNATIHSKIYVLEKEGFSRIIVGSPNLSFTAQGSRQREYVHVYDVKPGDIPANDLLAKVNADIQEHLKETDIVEFMEDLQAMRDSSGNPSDVDFRLWANAGENQTGIAMKTIMSDIRAQTFVEDSEANDVVHISVPESLPKRERNQLERMYGAKISNGRATLSRSFVIQHTTTHGVPLLEVQPNGQVKTTVNDGVTSNEWSDDVEDLDRSLSDIERYISLVDRGVCHYPEAMKMNLFEVVLHAFAAPFANEVMRERFEKNRMVNHRGPKHLVIYGTGHNGKTTLFRLLAHLLTGQQIEPVSGKSLNKKQWGALLDHARHMGTSMPIMVDDIKQSALNANGVLEDELKSHWENKWRPESRFPMIFVNTNHDKMADWTKSRLERLDILVRFDDDRRSHAVLSEIMSRPNTAFLAFAKLVSSLPKGSLDSGEDELDWAREIVLQLYELAGREVPSFFPRHHPGQLFNMDAVYCASRIEYGLVTKRRAKKARVLEFKTRPSMYAFRSRLPKSVTSSPDDKVLLIEPQSVAAFERFLKEGRSRQTRFPRFSR